MAPTPTTVALAAVDSSPLLDQGKRRTGLVKAAWQLENAICGKDLEIFPDNIERASIQHLQVLRFNKWYSFSLLCLVILTFVEVPTWCHERSRDKDIWTWYPGTEWCSVASHGTKGETPDLFLSGIYYLPPGYALIVEVIVEFIVLRKFALDYVFERRHFTPMGQKYHSMNLICWGCVFALGGIIDTAVFTFFRVPMRMTWITRTGLLFILPGVQKLFTSIFNRKMMTEFMSISVFLWGIMLFFAWIAVTLFGKSDQVSYREENGEAVPVNKGLDSLHAAFYSMFVAAVSGEFVDTFLPTFVSFRAAGIMWFSFLVLAKVLFENLTLDTLVSAYIKGAEKAREEDRSIQAKGMLACFRTLCELSGPDAEEIPKDLFLDFVIMLGRSPVMKPMTTKCAEVIYDHAGSLGPGQFCDVCGLLVSKLAVYRADSGYELENKGSWGELIHDAVWEPREDPKFDGIMNQVLVVNLVFVVLESSYNLNNWGDPPWWTDYAEVIFSFLYVGEVFIKLSVKSWGLYWSSFANRFDFFVTWLLLFSTLIPYLPGNILPFDLKHYANILRLLRLLRVAKKLKSLKAVQSLISTVTKMVGSAGDILLMLGTLVFFFTNLSVNLFGGVLYKGNPRLKETEYEEKYWYVFNFNDMFMAFSVWFSQLLCEYVPVNAEALEKAHDHGAIAWLIFPLFYFLSVAIMFEILLSFTVEAYVALREEAEFEEEEEESEEGSERGSNTGSEGSRKGSKKGSEAGSKAEHHVHEDLFGGHGHHEEKFKPDGFLEELQGEFAEQGQVIHYIVSDQPGYPGLLKEAYKEEIEKVEEEEEEEHEHKHGGDHLQQNCRAAWMLENAINRTHWKHYPLDVIAARASHFQLLRANKLYNLAMVCLVILTFWEVPPWCHAQSRQGHLQNDWNWVPGTIWCSVPALDNDDKVYNLHLSGMWYLPPGLALVAEFVIEAIIIFKFLLENSLTNNHFNKVGVAYSNHRNVQLGMMLSVGSIADTVFFNYAHNPFRLNWFFRTGLLFILPGVQRIYNRIFNKDMMFTFAGIAVFFAGAVIFFAWVVVTIFKDCDDFVMIGKEKVQANKGIEGFKAAVYTMFVSGIGEGFVDNFLPSFTIYRSSGLLWLVFMVIAQILLLNLVIDAFVASYLEGSEKEDDLNAEAQAEGTYDAFKTLKGAHGTAIPMERFLDFVENVGKSPHVLAIQRETATTIYGQFGDLNKERFLDACSIISNKVWTAKKDSCLKRCCPKLWDSPGFQTLRSSVWEPADLPRFDFVMNNVLMLNMCLVVVQSAYTLNGWGHLPAWMAVADMVFCFSYVGEVLVKLSVKSFGEYWSFGTNQFDFFTTWLLLGTSLLPYMPIANVKADLKKYANILRLLRLVRVFKQLKQFPRVQFMVQVVSRMVNGAGDILQLLGTMLFFFSILSVNLFGGVLYEGRPELKETDYAKKHWFVFNFNDMGMSFSTWFTQLLSEYVPENAEALQKTAQYGEIAWYIYPSFYILGVAIIFEIAKAFTIEYYLAIKEEEDDDEEEEEEEEEGEKRKEGVSQRAFLQKLEQELEDNGVALVYSIRDDSWTAQHELKTEFMKGYSGEGGSEKGSEKGSGH